MLHCHVWSPYWTGFLLQVIKCAVFPLTLPALGIYVARLIGPSELKITPMRTEPENVLSISSCWRHQRAKTHPAFFCLLSLLALFYPPSRSSLALFPSSMIPRPVPLSLSFLPPHIPRSFNSPAHDQMLKSFAASECVHTRHGNLSWSLEGGQQQHHTDPDLRAAFPQWKCDTSPLCLMPFNKKEKRKRKNNVPVHFSRCGALCSIFLSLLASILFQAEAQKKVYCLESSTSLSHLCHLNFNPLFL